MEQWFIGSMFDVMILSGGFDPVHKGHVRMFQAASELADLVIVGLNSDAWLINKKGKHFMGWDERAEILKAMIDVHEVWMFNDFDGTACDLIRRVRIGIGDKNIAFGNGGDRTTDNTPEQDLCDELEVHLVWGVGGDKIQSSSELVDNYEDMDG